MSVSKFDEIIATLNMSADPNKQQIPPLRCAPVGMTNHLNFKDRTLDVELEEEDVAVFDDVLFALGAEEACFFDGLFAGVLEEVGGGVAVGFDETFFEVGVDDAGGAGGFGAATDGPGADLLHPGGEVGDEVEQAIGGVDEAVEARLFEAE